MIVDDDVYVKPEHGFELAGVGETMAELGQEIGLPADALESTIELFSRYAEDIGSSS